ncbi:MAG: hypothetical protein H0V29_11310 [Thermoleophilaceae bacterium]|nr:hypothetical protein [Thermoleophilaceae bacterium]
MSDRSVRIAAAGLFFAAILVWVALVLAVGESCSYDCTGKGNRYAFLAVVVITSLLVPIGTLLWVAPYGGVERAPMERRGVLRVLLGANVGISAVTALAAIGITVLAFQSDGSATIALVGGTAAVLWIGCAAASLATRRINHLTGG